MIIDINAQDFKIIENDKYRVALLQAALHRPFQLQETTLDKSEQRYYLDKILHANESEVNTFLTKLDHGQANGAISNMVRKSSDRDIENLRNGDWFYWKARSVHLAHRLKLKFRLIYHKMVIQRRVLAPTAAVSCWFGRVAMARVWGGAEATATSQLVSPPRPYWQIQAEGGISSHIKPNSKHKKGEPKPTFFYV